MNVVHDPWRPVPAIGGHLSPNPGPAERSELDLRPDVAIFTSPPLEKVLRLEGVPSLILSAAADQKGFDICVALSTVSKTKKRVSQISTGLLRIEGENALMTNQYQVVLQPLLCEIKIGECLRVSIAGSAWPAIGINPGNDTKPIGPPGADCLPTNLAMYLNGSKIHFQPLIP